MAEGDVKTLVLNLVNDASIPLGDGVYAKAFSGTQYNILWKGRAYVEIMPLEGDAWRVVVPMAAVKKLDMK